MKQCVSCLVNPYFLVSWTVLSDRSRQVLWQLAFCPSQVYPDWLAMNTKLSYSIGTAIRNRANRNGFCALDDLSEIAFRPFSSFNPKINWPQPEPNRLLARCIIFGSTGSKSRGSGHLANCSPQPNVYVGPDLAGSSCGRIASLSVKTINSYQEPSIFYPNSPGVVSSNRTGAAPSPVLH